MKKRVLILTDHTNHSPENSLYDLSIKMLAHKQTECIDIISRGNSKNDEFFSCIPGSKVWATRITKEFKYQSENHPLLRDDHPININGYELVWLRLPPPLASDFLDFVHNLFSQAVIINNPKAIQKTGSKEFLINFPSICPPMKVCTSVNDINEFRKLFPIVLKPFNEYGGRGIVKIVNGLVSSGTDNCSFDEFVDNYKKNPINYLGVKYLKNVTQGDKRIVVVNGQILGASLRLPAENSWLCNVSMGGSSNMSEVEPEEKEIIQTINPLLTELGIVMYGVDTLVNDAGKRVLSEINTTSIGGIAQIAAMRQEPLVEKTVDLIWSYFNEKTKRS